MAILWNRPASTNSGGIANFHAVNNGDSFRIKRKITGKTADSGTEDVEIMVPLKYLSNFQRTLKKPLTNFEFNLILTWSVICVLSNDTKVTTFAITETKLYVLLLTLSTQDSAKLLQQLKSGFKRTINWNKYQSMVTTQVPNPYLDYLINPSFEGVNRIFVLSFENTTDRIVHTKYFLPTVEIKDYNVMIDGQNFFDQPVKIFKNIW